jgi:hypothetical protein
MSPLPRRINLGPNQGALNEGADAGMTAADWWPQLDRLLEAFPDHIRAALALASANAEDDHFIKMGVVGFLQFASMHEWGQAHWQIIRDLRAGAYCDEELEWFEDSGYAVAEFACLFYGSLLGLDVRGSLNDADREIAQAVLPGFIAGHLERIAAGAALVRGDA